MSNASTDMYDRTVDRAAMLRFYEEGLVKKIGKIIDEHKVRLLKLFGKDEMSDQKVLKEAINRELKETYTEAFRTSRRSLLELFSDQTSYAYDSVKSAIGDIWNPERPPVRLAEDVVLKRPLYADKTLEQGWSGVSTGERKRLEQIIRKGISEGKIIADIAGDVRDSANFNISKFQARSLVVTAVTSVTAQADHAVYMANEKSLAGWQYVAVLDSKTTPVCAGRDGKIYPTTDVSHLPPAHYNCRSKTVPVFKSWKQISELEGVANVRKRNLEGLTDKQKAYYDGMTPLKESYHDWLLRQPQDIQLKHLGDYRKLEMFQSGKLHVSKFTNENGKTLTLTQLRQAADPTYTAQGDSVKFANAKERLDAMQLGASRIEDLYDRKLKQTLIDYYRLQAGDLDGTLSLTNYRGTLIGNKTATKRRVLTNPPTEDQLKFNPVTGRYEDVRLYQPAPSVLANNLRLMNESEVLTKEDKAYISSINDSLEDYMSVNERAVVVDNLRIIFTRQRENNEVWGNFKAVVQSQIKFDVMNISDAIETQIRRDSDILKRLKNESYIDPVLGATQLDELHDNFLDNIRSKNKWEDSVAPKIAREMHGALQTIFTSSKLSDVAVVNPLIWQRLSDRDFQQFYLKFAHRLALNDSPDRDALAVSLGRDLYDMASLKGQRNDWYKLGMKILESPNVKKFFEIETFGVQKRRMKSRLSGAYFGPYYDTLAYNIRVVDPRIQEYSKLSRKVELGLRVAVTSEKNRLVFRKGYKTYFIDNGLTLEDTRMPITSTSSFSDFPSELVDESLVDALNWASKSKYKIDEDFYDFMTKLLYFEDDKGKAKYYNDLNEYRHYIASRGDAYERFKSMEWLRKSGKAFSNHPFVDHRVRIYDRGLISPQSGESFRPYLNTSEEKVLGVKGYKNFKDQLGAFLGGLDEHFEGRYNSLTVTGRQKIADRWMADVVKVGKHMLRAKPSDIRAVLESDIVQRIEGEELGKFLRFAIEFAKIDNYLEGNYSKQYLTKLDDYKTALALEQDASSSGAQIIALTTKNKQLAELSNVVPTTQKRRLYDEIAYLTYNDPRFKKINEKLGLTEVDLRKAAKAQNMVTFYGAGERTGIMNVEAKLGKALGKQEGTLVVKASDRDIILDEISARAARYKDVDIDMYNDLMRLRADVKDIFNKGLTPGEDIIESLYFLQPQTKDVLEKMTKSYDKVVTPEDFKDIASIMSEYLGSEVPILKDFSKYFGRLAEDFLKNAKPSNSAMDWKKAIFTEIRGDRKKGYTLPDSVSEILGLPAGVPLSEQALKRLPNWDENSSLADLLLGVKAPDDRRTGMKLLKAEIKTLSLDVSKATIGKDVKLFGITLFTANKLPKSWTNVPSVNFDGKVIEQNFTQSFEERLRYRNKDGTWNTNILQVPQKTELSWWDQMTGAEGKVNDIADVTKARTAYGVNTNHSNDAVIVKKFHLWGKSSGTATSTIHDAFFANAGDMLEARSALRKIYAEVLDGNIVVQTLNEMKARGFPEELYDKYIEEAIERGLIPIPGKSIVGGKVLKNEDILTKEDILQSVDENFDNDRYWYGVG